MRPTLCSTKWTIGPALSCWRPHERMEQRRHSELKCGRDWDIASSMRSPRATASPNETPDQCRSPKFCDNLGTRESRER